MKNRDLISIFTPYHARDNLITYYFYAYDKATNKYSNIKPEYRIDANGFLHFATNLGGDIVITGDPLLAGITSIEDLHNPETGGDGTGYFIPNTTTKASAQETSVLGVKQIAFDAPDDLVGQITLKIPELPGPAVVMPIIPVISEMPVIAQSEDMSLWIVAIIAVMLVMITRLLWVAITWQRRKKREW